MLSLLTLLSGVLPLGLLVIFWVELPGMEPPKRHQCRAALFFLTLLPGVALGKLYGFAASLNDNWRFGKRVYDILKIWENDPGQVIPFPPEPCVPELFWPWLCAGLTAAFCIAGVILACRKFAPWHFFFYCTLPLLTAVSAAWLFTASAHFRDERLLRKSIKEIEYVLKNAEAGDDRKKKVIRARREKFPVTYERPLWREIARWAPQLHAELEKKEK